MRVISGKLGGRRFNPPKLINTRPTTDFAKTGLFNILNNYIDFSDVSFLDLFSGTGSISYEFASRGCPRIVCVDKDDQCIMFIRKMKTDWSLKELNIIKTDVLRYLETTPEKFDVIFAGPPYAMKEIAALPEKIFERELLKEGGWFVLETDPKYDFSGHPHFFRRAHYGQTNFHFFK